MFLILLVFGIVSLTTAQSTGSKENDMQNVLNRMTYLEQWQINANKKADERQIQIESRIASLEGGDCQSKDGMPVGFTAYATDAREYSAGEVVQFDGIISNFGSHYDPLTSKFSCPHRGVYLFTIGFNAFHDGGFKAGIWKGDERLLNARVFSGNYWGQSSSFCLVECNEGEEVYAKAFFTGPLTMHGSVHRTSHFSGFLLHRF